MKTYLAYLLAILTAAALTTSARADFLFTFAQSGNDVVSTGEGSLDLSNLTFATDLPAGGGLLADCCFFVGPDTDVDVFIGSLDGPSTLNPNGPFNFHSSNQGTGDTFGLDFMSSAFFVPDGYASNVSLTGTATYENQTLNSLDLIVGEYEWTMGGNNSIRLLVTSQSVPEPSGAVAITLLAIVFLQKRRR